jgi:hypothetical protein
MPEDVALEPNTSAWVDRLWSSGNQNQALHVMGELERRGGDGMFCTVCLEDDSKGKRTRVYAASHFPLRVRLCGGCRRQQEAQYGVDFKEA